MSRRDTHVLRARARGARAGTRLWIGLAFDRRECNPTIRTAGGSSAYSILTAALCFRGRALALYAWTFPVKRKRSPKAEHEFLSAREDHATPCSPIVVTDAGVLAKWYDAVGALGWNFVGRLRGTRQFCLARIGSRWRDFICGTRWSGACAQLLHRRASCVREATGARTPEITQRWAGSRPPQCAVAVLMANSRWLQGHG